MNKMRTLRGRRNNLTWWKSLLGKGAVSPSNLVDGTWVSYLSDQYSPNVLRSSEWDLQNGASPYRKLVHTIKHYTIRSNLYLQHMCNSYPAPPSPLPPQRALLPWRGGEVCVPSLPGDLSYWKRAWASSRVILGSQVDGWVQTRSVFGLRAWTQKWGQQFHLGK
jgi:hypothetical protein